MIYLFDGHLINLLFYLLGLIEAGILPKASQEARSLTYVIQYVVSSPFALCSKPVLFLRQDESCRKRGGSVRNVSSPYLTFFASTHSMSILERQIVEDV